MKVTVIGGGIAGVAAGYHLATKGQEVTLLEQEGTLAYHSTGRSAAVYLENYGALANRALTRASRPFFESPPAGLVDHPLLAPRGALWVGREEQMASLEQEMTTGGPTTRWLEPLDACKLAPALKPDYLAGAVWEPDALDLDVAAIHQAFVRGMRQAGAMIRTSSQVTALVNRHGRWAIEAGTERITADVVVNAAGAWCDVVAAMAGAKKIGLEPKRRTAFMVPGDPAYAAWPLVANINNEFYFRPDGIQVLCSLADETPVEPGDARPDELDIALAIERINRATTLGIRTVRASWAGLRSFVSDRAMVIGFDPTVPGFVWLAGQGGTGIQTAPAAGELTAGLICKGDPPERLLDEGLDLAALSPGRLG